MFTLMGIGTIAMHKFSKVRAQQEQEEVKAKRNRYDI